MARGVNPLLGNEYVLQVDREKTLKDKAELSAETEYRIIYRDDDSMLYETKSCISFNEGVTVTFRDGDKQKERTFAQITVFEDIGDTNHDKSVFVYNVPTYEVFKNVRPLYRDYALKAAKQKLKSLSGEDTVDDIPDVPIDMIEMLLVECMVEVRNYGIEQPDGSFKPLSWNRSTPHDTKKELLGYMASHHREELGLEILKAGFLSESESKN